MTIKIDQSELAAMLAVLAPYMTGCLSTGVRVKDKRLELFIHRVEHGSALALVPCKKTPDHDWVFIDGPTLYELVRVIHDGSISMSFTETSLMLKSPGTTSELRRERLGFPLEAVEAISVDSRSSIIKGKDLALLSLMTEAASADETRPTLNGIYLAAATGGLKVAAADGFILAFTSMQAEKLNITDGVYSAIALNCARRAIKPEEDEDISIGFNNGGITLSIRREKAIFSFHIPRIHESFVNYQPIITGIRKAVTVQVETRVLGAFLKRAKAIDGHMYMQVVNGHLWMMAVSGDKQENKSIDSIAVETKDQSAVMHYNESMLRDVLGHWVGQGNETSNFWLSVITDLQTRGVKDIFIACMDGLSGFKEAVLAVFPQTQIQRCVIHQIRNSLKYITWTDRKAFMVDLKEVYQAATRESAEAHLRQLGEKWNAKYAIAIRSWQNNWEDLATFFAYPAEIRRLIYTTNAVEGYHRQLRKVTKSKSIFPTPEAARKLLFLAHRDILKKWTLPIQNWPLILNQLVIRFEGRLAI